MTSLADGLGKLVAGCLWFSWLDVQLEGGAVSTKDLQEIHTHHLRTAAAWKRLGRPRLEAADACSLW